MDNKAAKSDHRPWLTPSLTVADIKTSQQFYANAFGFTIGESFDDETGETVFGEMYYHDLIIMMLVKEKAFGCTVETPTKSRHAPATGLYVYCDDVDDLYKMAGKAKATIVIEPQDMFWGDRTVTIQDPDGHSWNFATRISNFVFNPATNTA